MIAQNYLQNETKPQSQKIISVNQTSPMNKSDKSIQLFVFEYLGIFAAYQTPTLPIFMILPYI